MLGFLRRPARVRQGGRHSLGAAVTAIPSSPHRVVLPAAAAPADVAPAVAAYRVELGFRDGTTAALEPASAQAQALMGLADLLSGRRQPSGSRPAPERPTPPE